MQGIVTLHSITRSMAAYIWKVEAINTFQRHSHKHGKGVDREGQKLQL